MSAPCILIVEDEYIVAMDLERSLRDLGYTIIGIASSGIEAVTTTRTTSPDLVLMDIRLQGEIDGIAAAEQIRAADDIPIVYLTAYNDSLTRLRATATNPYGYLIKPFDERTLQTTIEASLARHRTDREVRASARWVTATLDSLGEAVVTFDAAGLVTYLNPTAVAILGITTDDAVGRPLSSMISLVDPRTSQPLHTADGLLRQAEGSTPLFQEALLQRADGTQVPVEWRATTIEIELQHALGAVLVLHDLTSRKEAEAALKELNRTLEERICQRSTEVQDLYDHAPAGYHSLDADGRLIQVNQTELDWLGYTREEMLGRPVTDFVTPRSCALFAEQFPRFKQHGRVRDLEFEFIRKDGTTIPVLLSATAIYDGNGAFVTARSVLLDMTERKRVDAALRESQASLQDFLDTASDLIQSLDADGHIQYVNNAWCEILGYTAIEVLQHSIFDVLDPASHAHCRTIQERLLRSAQAQQMEVTFRTKDGQAVVAEGSVSVRRGSDGRVTTNGIFRNITRRKQAEEAQRLANRELQRALRIKDEFLANMSHELRTPLHSILALSEVLLDELRGPINTLQQESIRRIVESSNHLLALINDILDLSKVEAGRLDLEPERVLVNDVCQASLQFVKELAIKKGLHLGYQLNDRQAKIVVDPRRLKQILVNLLANAVKFTPEGGMVSLDVDVQPENASIRFIVQDTGMGIAPDDLPRLFQPFTQLESRMNHQHEGTGLGLALVRRLTRMHGGGVTVESDVGKGSIFTVALPYNPAEASEPDANMTATRMGAEQAAPRPRPMMPGVRILLAEDNETTLTILSEYLNKMHFNVVVARTGREALDLATTQPIDLILMDIQMPELDGLEVMRRLRALPTYATTPIIALTALAMPGDRERCLVAGASEYVTKPVSLRWLVELIQRLVKP